MNIQNTVAVPTGSLRSLRIKKTRRETVTHGSIHYVATTAKHNVSRRGENGEALRDCGILELERFVVGQSGYAMGHLAAWSLYDDNQHEVGRMFLLLDGVAVACSDAPLRARWRNEDLFHVVRKETADAHLVIFTDAGQRSTGGDPGAYAHPCRGSKPVSCPSLCVRRLLDRQQPIQRVVSCAWAASSLYPRIAPVAAPGQTYKTTCDGTDVL